MIPEKLMVRPSWRWGAVSYLARGASGWNGRCRSAAM